jgi:alkylation response protein AidB-like acyl-CoA dehydrogenase
MNLATKAGVASSATRRPIPPFTPKHEEFRTAVRRFVQSELRPHAREWEDARWFPNDVFTRLAELGYLGLKFPPEYGGDGDAVADAVFAERLLMALGAVGAMQVAFEKTLAFALEREAFGRKIGHHQAIRHKLAEIAVTIEAGRDVTYSALRRYVAGEDAVREVTIAKLTTQRSSFEVMDTCLQLHGGAGYIAEYEIERAARDARLGPIGGGTDEIMKEILGRSLGL